MNDFIHYATLLTKRKADTSKAKTSEHYGSALRALIRFLNHEGRTTVLPFSDVTRELIERFEAYLLGECGVTRNTSSFYIRNVRAIWNEAARDGLTPHAAAPFDGVYTGVDATRHRATTNRDIAAVIRARLDDNPALAFARDVFIFSFFGHGIAFVDIAKMRKCDLCGGHITYARSKTGKPLCVSVLPVMQEIIDRWGDPASPFLLPVVELPFTARHYDTALRRYNRHLHQLSERLGLQCQLTSYIARHSWASEAYRLQVPVSVISTCMGHSTEATTRIYLRSLDTTFIDSQVSVVEQFFMGSGAGE